MLLLAEFIPRAKLQLWHCCTTRPSSTSEEHKADRHTAPSDPVSRYLEVDAKPARQPRAEGPGDMTFVTQLLLADTSEDEC
jgi:hypothetical protein